MGGGTASAVAGGPSVYTCGITPTAAGTVTVDLPADKCQDAATNTNKAATQLTRTSITSLGCANTFSTFGAKAMTFTLANAAVATGNSTRVLIAEGCARSNTPDTPTVSGVTYGGTAMTLVPGSTITDNNSNQVMAAALYYLKNPAVGTASVVVALSASADVQTAMVAAISLYDACVHGGNDPIGAVATCDNGVGDTACTSITSTSDYSWLVDVVTGNTTSVSFTPGALQVTRWALSMNNWGAGSTKPVDSACSTTMSWTLGIDQSWCILKSTAEIKIAR